MSTTLGRVDWIAGIDGTLLPSESRRLGNQIGQALGQAASRRSARSFAQGVGSDWDVDSIGTLLGRRLANSLGGAFRGRFQAAIGDAGASLRKAIDPAPLREFNEVAERGVYVMYEQRDAAESAATSHGRFRDAIRRASDSVKNYSANLRDQGRLFRSNISGARLFGGALRGLFSGGSDDGRGFATALGEINDKWRSLSHGLRQGIFYVALFASLASDIAVLGSAAGSGLTVLAGAAFQAVIGIGVLVAAFSNLGSDLAELPAAVRPAAAAFQALGDTFSKLRDMIQERAIAGLTPQFEALNGLIDTLTPSILLVADAVGRVITQLVTMLTSANGVAVLKGLIEGAAPVFELLASAAMNLGGAIGNIFLTAQPYILAFSGWLNTLLTEFNNWTQSVSGQNALKEWFENGKTVFEALVPLLSQVGSFLSNLVTPAAVQSLVTFMGIIGGALAPLGAFLSALNSFGIWNILAQLINTVFTALQPLMPLFTLLGTTIQTLVLGALQAITPLLTMLVQAFAAFAAPLIGAVIPAVLQLLPIFQQLVTALMPIVMAITMLAMQLGQALAPILTTIIGAFLQLVTAIMPLIQIIIPPLVAIITVLTSTLMPLINAVLPPLISLFTAVMDAIMPIIPVLVELIAEILELIEPLLELLGPILPPLTEALKFLVTAGVNILKAALEVLVPVIMGVVNGIKTALTPAIEGIKGVLKAVVDFLTNVFLGNWDKVWSSALNILVSIGKAIVDTIRGIVNGAVSIINGMIGGINSLTGAVGIPAIPKIPKWASGGIAWQSMIANIGEAGPEMVVPLRRPLSMVDPSVRDVAAYAQGKQQPAGPGVVIEAGAIVVEDRSGDPRRTGNEVFGRIVEEVAS